MQTRMNITLPEDLARDLRLMIPLRSRSKFIAKVVREKLPKKRWTNKEWIKALRANYELDKKIAQDWKAVEVEGWPD